MKNNLILRASQIACLLLLLSGCAQTAQQVGASAEAMPVVTRDIVDHRNREEHVAETTPPTHPAPAAAPPAPVRIAVGSPPPMREFNPTLSSATVEYHVWQPLTQLPAAAWRSPRYKMYTYVLFNGAAYRPKLNYDERQALQRLGKLLDTIGHSEDFAGTTENQTRNRQATNVFLIPANAAGIANAQLENYNIGVSRQYLEYFNSALSNNKPLHKQLRKSGPFLLATLKPIGEILKVSADGTSYQIDRSQPILLVNMTGAHEKSVAEVVRTFKNHVADVPLSGTTAFEPLRLKLVSMLLKLNDAIPIVNNAVAGSCSMVGTACVEP